MENVLRTAQEEVFLINGLELAAKFWHKSDKTGVIALHGWLDNANSFDPLAPLLTDMPLVALDSAGHGKSDFRSPDASYLIWSEVGEIMQVADQLGWERFVLVGHSRGAGIASLAAGTFPERISHLVLIEGGVPLPITANEAPTNLAKAILMEQQLLGSTGTLFSNKQKALDARANGFTKVQNKTAEILGERSLIKEADGYRWHADARLKGPSTFKLTHAQIDAFLSHITAPTLLILGDEGIVGEMSFTRPHIQQIPDLKKVVLPGQHHLHMEGAEEQIAALIQQFLIEK